MSKIVLYHHRFSDSDRSIYDQVTAVINAAQRYRDKYNVSELSVNENIDHVDIMIESHLAVKCALQGSKTAITALSAI